MVERKKTNVQTKIWRETVEKEKNFRLQYQQQTGETSIKKFF
jgi:hypothetical protein